MDAHSTSSVERNVERGNYTGLVNAVLAQVSAGLGDHTHSDEDVQGHAAKRLKTLSSGVRESAAKRAMNARFALGADDVMYLQNAVSVLAAGHDGDDEIPIRSGEMLGVNVIESVRRIVEAEMRSRELGRAAEAPGQLEMLMDTVKWLLLIDEVREAITEPDTGEPLLKFKGGSTKDFDPEATHVALKKALKDSPEDRQKVCSLLLQLYAMLSNDFAPGMLASQIEEAMRKSARDVDAAREDHRSSNLAYLTRLREELAPRVIALAADLLKAKRKLAARTIEYAQLNFRYKASAERIKTLKKEKANLRDEVVRLELEAETLRETIAAKDDRIAALQKELELCQKNEVVLQKQVADALAEIANLETEVQANETEISDLKAEKRDQAELIKDKNAKIVVFQLQLSAVRRRVANLQNDKSELEGELEDVKAELGTEKAERGKADVANEALRSELLQQKTALEEARTLLESKRQELNAKDAETANLSRQVKFQKARLARLQKSYGDLILAKKEIAPAVKEVLKEVYPEQADELDDGDVDALDDVDSDSDEEESAGGEPARDEPAGNDSVLKDFARNLWYYVVGSDPAPSADPAPSVNPASSADAVFDRAYDAFKVSGTGALADGSDLKRVRESNPPAGEKIPKYKKGAAQSLVVYEYSTRAVNKTEPLMPAAVSDDLARYAEYRGLVGQRGPEEPAANDEEKAALPYNVPWSIKSKPGHLLGNDMVSEHMEVAKAPLTAQDRRVTEDIFAGSSGTDRVLDKMRGDYAVIPALTDTDDTIEESFVARWRPMGVQCTAVAKAAAFEHAAQRCKTMADNRDGLSEPDVLLLRAAAASLKLRQLESMLVIHEHLAEHRHGHSLILDATIPLVTRPLARLRRVGKLCFPIDCGLQRIPDEGDVEDPIADDDWFNAKAIPPPDAYSKSGGKDPDDVYGPYSDKFFTFAKLSAALQEITRPADSAPTKPPAVYVTPEVGRLQKVDTYRYPLPTTEEKAIEYGKTFKGQIATLDVADASYLSRQRLMGLIRNGLGHCEALNLQQQSKSDPIKHFHADSATAAFSGPLPGTAAAVRGGLWKEMLRELAISNDRLWIFVRTLSGSIGEDASSLLSTADEEAQRAQRSLEAERKAVAERVATFQSKIVEVLVGSLLRTSKLEVLPDGADQALMVLDAEAAKQMRDLASGESGRPFFEANVAMQNMLNKTSDSKLPLSKLVQNFNGIVRDVHTALTSELERGTGASGSVTQLAEARNSYFVSLRPDVTTAMRSALDRFHHEIGSRRPCLWELIEGASSTLSLRFAELVGHVLVQTRNSTGSSAIYVSATQQAQTAMQARVALMRLVSEARHYLASAPDPNFQAADGRHAYFASAPQILNGVGAPHVAIGRAVVSQLVVNADVSGWQPFSRSW